MEHTYTLAGKKFDFRTPISEVVERLGWKVDTVRKRRKEALRLVYPWHTVDWKAKSTLALAQELDLPLDDIEAMKKTIFNEAKKWALIDYERSDEEIAAAMQVQPDRAQYYRQFYDKGYDGKKQKPVKDHMLSVRLPEEMYETIEFQAKKTGYKIPAFIRLVLMQHLVNFPFFPPDEDGYPVTKPSFISPDDLDKFRRALFKRDQGAESDLTKKGGSR